MNKEGEPTKPANFIEQMIEKQLAEGVHKSIRLRFPPEPNGYLHIGHAKSICLNFGLVKKNGGTCNLRFDDTNPEKEEVEFIEAIKNDIRWLGYEWDEEHYTSDYFDALYEMALLLINKGLAYIDELPAEEFNRLRGTPTKEGVPSPYRERPIEENVTLFQKMKSGALDEGACVLRAKIDLTSPNMHLRDPILYRIKKVSHPRTQNEWKIYPTYDFAHGQSDSIEKITNSLCTLEFEVHRPLYEWLIQQLEIYPSKQTEFARLNLSYTVVSKRHLRRLVEENKVTGWDDPRMPTISGMRRRGYPPKAIQSFTNTIGVARRDGVTDIALLEHAVREELNKTALRRFGILDPLKLVITNWEEGKAEYVDAINNPENPSAGDRKLLLTKEIYIERADFLIDPPSPRKWFRLGPDREVRLKFAYIICCIDYDLDETGKVQTVYATYDADTKSGSGISDKKVKGTLSWVSAQNGIPVEIRTYDRLLTVENSNLIDDDLMNHFNVNSLEKNQNAIVEQSFEEASEGEVFQLERVGYFRVDEDTTSSNCVLNRVVTLRDSKRK